MDLLSLEWNVIKVLYPRVTRILLPLPGVVSSFDRKLAVYFCLYPTLGFLSPSLLILASKCINDEHSSKGPNHAKMCTQKSTAPFLGVSLPPFPSISCRWPASFVCFPYCVSFCKNKEMPICILFYLLICLRASILYTLLRVTFSFKLSDRVWDYHWAPLQFPGTLLILISQWHGPLLRDVSQSVPLILCVSSCRSFQGFCSSG